MKPHLPEGVACRVYYRGAEIDIPDPKDPFEVCNAARARIFGGKPLEVDPKFDAVMARRKGQKAA